MGRWGSGPMVFGLSSEDIISSQIGQLSETPSHITPSQCISIRQRIGFSWYRDRLSFLLFRIEIHTISRIQFPYRVTTMCHFLPESIFGVPNTGPPGDKVSLVIWSWYPVLFAIGSEDWLLYMTHTISIDTSSNFKRSDLS